MDLIAIEDFTIIIHPVKPLTGGSLSEEYRE